MTTPFSHAGFARRSLAFELPVRAAARLVASRPSPKGDCQLVVSGSLQLTAVAAEWIVRRLPTGTGGGVKELRTTVPLLPPVYEVPIPRRTVRAAVTESSTLWLEFVDGRGRRLGECVYLGRRLPCLRVVRAAFALPVLATADAIATGRAARPVPSLVARGTIRMSGVAAKLALSADIPFEGERPVHGPFAPRMVPLADMVLIRTGETVFLPPQHVPGGDTPAPWLWVQWRHGNGAPIGSEQMLGRCPPAAGIAAG